MPIIKIYKHAEEEAMYKIIIYGTGESLKPVMETIVSKEIILGLLDNNVEKINTFIEGIKIVSPYDIFRFDYDYIIVATVHYKSAVEQLEMLGVEKEKIVLFYDTDIDFSQYSNLFRTDMARWESFRTIMAVRQQEMLKRFHAAMNNMEYEIVGRILKNDYSFPDISSINETLEVIIKNKVSMSRYGDGEFELMAGHTKYSFQKDDYGLCKRLKEILTSNLPGHIVALADDYGSLIGKNDDIKYTIRKYMTKERRKSHISILDLNKKYYNAYISRPYSIYDEEEMKFTLDRFLGLKKIWDNKNIAFIEGNKTRLGVGNDLFQNANSIKRIIAPNKDAFSRYDIIFEEAKKLSKDILILIALGPTATVLAYDLAVEGYQALDIGHLDLEYEWFLKGKGQTYVPHKYNNEVYGDERVISIMDDDYIEQILVEIE